jgi:hypothetical protein
MFPPILLENAELMHTPHLPLDSPLLLTLVTSLLSQLTLMSHLHLDVSLSDLLPELGLPLMTVETLSLEFKPSPSKTLWHQPLVLMTSVFSHPMEITIASILLLLTSCTIVMPVEQPAMSITEIAKIQLDLLLDVLIEELNCVSEPRPITSLILPILSLSP